MIAPPIIVARRVDRSNGLYPVSQCSTGTRPGMARTTYRNIVAMAAEAVGGMWNDAPHR
jgi:hypothetical protein